MLWFLGINGGLLLVILLVVLASRNSYSPFGTFVGKVFWSLVYDNNARATALFLVAGLLAIECLVVSFTWGMPQSPLVSGLSEEAQSNTVIEKYGLTDGLATERLVAIFKGADPTKVIKHPPQEVADSNPSHIWWMTTLLSWVAACIYWPVSRRDEVAEAFASFAATFQRRKATSGQAESGTNDPEESSGGTAAKPKSSKSKWFDWKWLSEYLLDDLFAEVVVNWMRKGK
jgi:hypothetical protein